MIFHRIEDTGSPWFDAFQQIYSVSFPLHEQRTPEQQERAFGNPAYHLDIIADEKEMAGFIAWWDFDGYIYIEHLAIHPDQRGKQMGSRMLDAFAREHDRVILLEIDPLVDEVSRKRLSFYEKLGYHMNGFVHTHPPYREGFAAHELIVLSYPVSIEAGLFERFSLDLSSVVMC